MPKYKLILLALLFSTTLARPALIPVVTGLNAITIPTVPSMNYGADNIFATSQDGEVIYVYNPVPGAWTVYTFSFGFWDPFTPVFTPGQGIFYYAVGPQTFVANLQATGNNHRGPPQTEALAYQSLDQNRYYFQGSPTGDIATYEDVFGGEPNDETALFRFIPQSANYSPIAPPYYRMYTYKAGVWSPETPVLDPLEPVFVVFPYLSLKYTVTGSPRRIDFTWPRGVLQEADFPNGPWRDVITPGNAYSVTPSEHTEPRYYQVKE